MFLTNSTSKTLRISVLQAISMDKEIEISAVTLRPGSGMKFDGRKDYIISEEPDFREKQE